MRFAPRLVIMVKEPVAGRVKTRLARDIGVVAATSVYRSMLGPICARLSRDPRWHTILAVSPDTALASRMLPYANRRLAQGSGNLGQRLQRIFDTLPPGPVVVIGTDIPGIMPVDIARAFRAAGSHDAALGPSLDGGYWLVGLRRRPRVPRAFDRVRWSSIDALADTAANLSSLDVAQLNVHDDVDDSSDLKRQSALIGRRILPAGARARA